MTTCAATTPLICTGQMLPSPQRDLSTCTPQQPASNNTTCINNSNTASHKYSLTPYTKHEDNNSNMAYIAEAGDTNETTNMQSIYCRGYSDCSGHVSPLTVYSGRDSTNRGLLTPFPVHMSEHGKSSRSSAFHNNNNIHIPRRVKEIPFSCIRPNKLIDTLHYHLDVLHEAIITRVCDYTSYPHIPHTRGHTTPERQTEDTENHFSTSDNNNNINNNNNNNNNNTVDRDFTTPRNASILDNPCKRKYNYYHDLLCKMSDILVAEAERVYPKRGLSMGIISNSALNNNNNNNNNNNKDINRIISNRSSISISDIYHCYNNGLSHEHHVSPNTEDNNNINNNNNNDNNNNNSFLSTAGTMIAKLADELIKCRTENNNNINNNNIKRGNENHCNDTKSLILLGSPSPLLTNKIINMNNNIINTDYSNKGYTYLSSWNKFISLMTCYIPTDNDLRSINNSRRNINNNLNNNNLNSNKLPNMYLESENAIDITKKESHIQVTDTKIRNMSLTTIYRLCEYFVTNTLITDKDNNIKDNINNNNNNNNNNNSDIANVERLNTVYTDQSHGDTYNNNNNLNNNLNNINDVFTIKDAAAVVTYWKRLRGIV